MEKREQRVRRDRRRDGKRNTFQNEKGKETVKQQDFSVEEKKNDAQNVEVSNKKNTSEEKDKIVEDDPLRFANLKRETDEIAALKAKKPHKRQVFSNWSKYEEPLPSLDESRAVDFEALLHAPQSGGFRFKSEQQWDTGSYGRFGELFTPDAELLVGGLTSLPFYKRLCIDKTLFSEDEIERMDSYAKTNSVAYEKLSKSKPKPKVAPSDLFKIDQVEKYSVVDQVNGPNVEVSTSTSKPVFSVEEPTDATPAEPSLPARAAGSSVELSDVGRENTTAVERGPEGAARDFHFGKPPTSSSGAAENLRSVPCRERTPLGDDSPVTASPEFHFERAPPPSYASSNVKSPFHSRETTPAKEVAPATVSRAYGGSRAPVSRGSSDVQFTGRESTSDRSAPPIRESEKERKVREDGPTAAGLTSPASVPSGDVSSREGTPAGEREENGASRENSPVRKVTYDRPRVAPFSTPEVKHSFDKIPSKVDVPVREEIPKEPVLRRNGADSKEEPTRQKSPCESDTVSEQKLDENEQICTESDSYSKKRGKPDVKKPEGQQRGGGRHGRRKKGQNASARGGEQVRVDTGDVTSDTADRDAECTVPTATKAAAPEEAGHEEPRPAEVKKKPERPPPPAMLQQSHQQSPPPPPAPQPSPTPTYIGHSLNKFPLISFSTPGEPKAEQLSTPTASPDSQAQPPQRKPTVGIKVEPTVGIKVEPTVGIKVEPVPKERSSSGRADDDGLNFLMSLRGQKTGGVSEVEAAKSAAGAAVSRSAIEEDEIKESQKPKPPPVIATEKKEDLEDWLDSMLDD